MLTKKQTLVKIHPEQNSYTHTYFQYEGDDDAYRIGYYLPMVDWVEMGCPQELTVEAVPGSHMDNDLGLRDQGERVDWDIDRNMSVGDAAVFDRGRVFERRLQEVARGERDA